MTLGHLWLASFLELCQAIRLIVFLHATVAPGSTQHSSTNFGEREVRFLFFFLAFCACFFHWLPLLSDAFFTFSSISNPGLNVTTFLAGTITFSPVRGLRAFLGFRCLTSKTPKLRSSIRPSLSNVLMIPSK